MTFKKLLTAPWPLVLTLPQVAVSAGTITMSGGPAPHPPICDSACVFTSAEDYAQNLVRKTMRDNDAFYALVSATALRKDSFDYPMAGWTVNVPPAKHKEAERLGWIEQVQIKDVTQEVTLGPPRLLRTVPGFPHQTRSRETYCGPNQTKLTYSSQSKETTDQKTMLETEDKETKAIADSISVNASAGSYVSANANRKVTTTAEHMQHTIIATEVSNEAGKNQTTELELPAYSFISTSVTDRQYIDIYQADGVVETDATLWFWPLSRTFEIGRLSAMMLEKAVRETPITVTIKVPRHDVTYDHTPHTFQFAEACEAAVKQADTDAGGR